MTLYVSGVILVSVLNCKYTSNFFLIVDFKQTNICWVLIEKTNTFENEYIMDYVVVF